MKGFLNIFSNKNTINAQNKSTENKISNQANIKLVNKYSSNQNTNNTKINKGGFITNTSTTANENPGISEYSNKIKQKDGIDAIFAASKSMILEDAKIDPQELLKDFTKTWKISIEFLLEYVESTKMESQTKNELFLQIESLRNLFKLRKSKRSEASDIRGRNLISNLIHADIKRKIQASENSAKDQLSDIQENLVSKVESAKSLEKKFKEYEKYVHKHSKLSSKAKFNYLRTFDIKAFVDENLDYEDKKFICKKVIEDYKRYINDLKAEVEYNLNNYKTNNLTTDKLKPVILFNEKLKINNNSNNISDKTSSGQLYGAIVSDTPRFKKKSEDYTNKNSGNLVGTSFRCSSPFNSFYDRKETGKNTDSLFKYSPEIPKGNIKTKVPRNNTHKDKVVRDEEKDLRKLKKIIVSYLDKIKELEEKIQKLRQIKINTLSTNGIRHVINDPQPKLFENIKKDCSLINLSIIGRNVNESNFIDFQQSLAGGEDEYTRCWENITIENRK